MLIYCAPASSPEKPHPHDNPHRHRHQHQQTMRALFASSFLPLSATNNPMFSFVIITIHTIKKLVYKHATLLVDIAFRNICWARTMVKQPSFMSKTSQICTSIRRVPSSKMRSIGRCRLEFCGRVRCRDMYSRFQRLRVVLSR